MVGWYDICTQYIYIPATSSSQSVITHGIGLARPAPLPRTNPAGREGLADAVP